MSWSESAKSMDRFNFVVMTGRIHNRYLQVGKWRVMKGYWFINRWLTLGFLSAEPTEAVAEAFQRLCVCCCVAVQSNTKIIKNQNCHTESARGSTQSLSAGSLPDNTLPLWVLRFKLFVWTSYRHLSCTHNTVLWWVGCVAIQTKIIR